MAQEFTLPDLGEGIAEAQIVRVLVKPGDRIALDQYVLEVETDKAAVEIPSPYAGVIAAVNVHEGQVVNVGDVVITFDENGRDVSTQAAAPTAAPAAAPKAPAARESTAAPSAAPPRAPGPPIRGKTTAPAAPAIRKLAREMGIDLYALAGTGPGGRITREDLEKHAAGAGEAAGSAVSKPAWAIRPGPRPATPPTEIAGTPDKDNWGSIRRVPLNQIRKTIANQMSRSASTIPHVTHIDEADISELDRLRRGWNELTGNDPKITPLTFLIRATCLALRKFPIFNASFDEEGEQIIYKEYISLGIAVDTERGLIVPVIRNTDQLTLRGIAAALRTIADQVRSKKFTVDDLRGGTFTISNVGALGGMFATSIINYPEVAIIAVGRSRTVPVLSNGQLTEALKLPLCVSFDHRATDGANAARFTREIVSCLETPARFLLD
ncbi:MAG: dihydrolipoamide acetyltransferase family protein [Planctomycetota bacterium]|jgi:pyruvate dehydrogenase E2 component (dihydrolipoamide acetyltransferase)